MFLDHYISPGRSVCFKESFQLLAFHLLISLKPTTQLSFEILCHVCVLFFQLPVLCEKGLTVGQSRITMLGDPKKGMNEQISLTI